MHVLTAVSAILLFFQGPTPPPLTAKISELPLGQRQLFGDLHLSTLLTIRMLGSTLRDRGDLDEAETLYRDALRIARVVWVIVERHRPFTY